MALLTTLFLLSFIKIAYAESSVITCTAQISGSEVYITGQIQDSTKSNQVTLLIGESEDIIYIDQVESNISGDFEFRFYLSDDLPIGEYPYKIGSNANGATYQGILNYTAEEGEPITPVQTIICTAEVKENTVHISGQIQNASGTNQVTLFVGEVDDIIYIDQTESASNGDFNFEFSLPDGLLPGDYTFKIGSNANATSYQSILTYTGERTVTNEIVDIDVLVNVNSYVPSIEGTINCYYDRTITVNVENVTDGTVIFKDTIEETDGTYNLSVELPSLLYPKKYALNVTCDNDTDNLMLLNATIDSSVILISAEGNFEVQDNVSANVSLQSVDSDLINKSTVINENKRVSVTIPNVVANASYRLTVECFETTTVIESGGDSEENDPTDDTDKEPGKEPVMSNTYTFTKNADEVFNVIVLAKGITSFDNEVFVVNYDEAQIEPISLFAAYPENSLKIGKKGKVEILSLQSGEIRFKVINTDIISDYKWQGILNIFKFKFKSDYSGSTTINVSSE